MAAKYISIVLFNIVSICLHAQTELKSPCPNLFLYQFREDSTDRWYGLFNLVSEDDSWGVELKVMLDKPALQLGNLLGHTTTSDLKEFTITNRYFRLTANSSRLVRFYVEYDATKAVPALVAIEQNGKRICPNSVNSSTPDVFVSVVLQSAEEIAIERYCGKTSMTRAAPLILYGQNSTEGEWPWHAAIYKNEAGALKYICGGSIISTHFILTAAHCVTDLSTGHVLNPSNFSVYVGTADLKDFSSSTQTLQLSRIHAHPDFSRPNLRNDIAILQMAIPIDYTAYARPVCLWQGNDDLQSVVGKLGTVVGWGLSENNKMSDILKQAEMPIVGTLDCIYSKPEFYSKFTSPSSFCAGFRDGTGPCNGDSGSGMVLNKPDGAGGNSWYLRGLVSLSIPLQGKTVCNPNEYIIFTDVAKYVSWIREVVLKPR